MLGRPKKYFRRVAEHAATRWEPVDLPEVLEGFDTRKVAFTFDDGYEGVYTNALPVLEEFDIPATVFVNPGFFGGRNRKARLANLENEGDLLSERQLEELAEHPLITIGNHTRTHHPLSVHRDRDVLEDEIVGGKEMLEERFDINVDRFCYPYNRFNEASASIARATHTFVLAERYGHVTPTTSPSRLPRISAERGWRRFRWETSRLWALFNG